MQINLSQLKTFLYYDLSPVNNYLKLETQQPTDCKPVAIDNTLRASF